MTMPKGLSPNDEDLEVRRQLRRMTRRGLVFGGSAVLVAGAAWRWAISRSQDGLIPWPLRRVLELDEKVGRAIFRPGRPAPTFPSSVVRMPRVNGRIGIDPKLDLDRWRLRVTGPAGARAFTMADVKALPRVEMTTELKCIEGWSEVVTWSGARLRDLAEATGLARRSGKPGEPTTDPADLLPFVSLTTPDARYFVGLDIASALHPQTLLCYEMNGQPLTLDHGAPLRLAIPVKYGIKSIKQIGTLAFTDKQPSDYWAEKGYDWYSGH
jgi:DMSO/TMAO reductase YedYZ molybdopterin-dependent catalytic subunit